MSTSAALTISELEKNRIAHLEVLRADGRDEIKRRIQQRDQYSIQLTIALSTVLGAAFVTSRPKIIILAPLVTIYFIKLILTSYHLHELIVHWLRTHIEPELARLCNTPPDIELETWLAKQGTGLRRRKIFVMALWGVLVFSMGYLFQFYGRNKDERLFLVLLILASIFYVWLNFTYVGAPSLIRENEGGVKSDSIGE